MGAKFLMALGTWAAAQLCPHCWEGMVTVRTKHAAILHMCRKKPQGSILITEKAYREETGREMADDVENGEFSYLKRLVSERQGVPGS